MVESCGCVEESPDVDLVIFDLYGTLVDWRHNIGSFIELYISGNAIDDFFVCDIREVQKYKPYREVLSKCLVDVALKYKVVVDKDLIEAFIHTFAKSPPFPDTIYGLKITKRHGFKTAILSNTDRELVEITLYGMKELFDYVVTAEDIRAYKPSISAFLRAYELIGTSSEKVIHVSAYPQYDLEPALKIGARTVLVDRGLGYNWIIKIRSLLELPEVLRALN